MNDVVHAEERGLKRDERHLVDVHIEGLLPDLEESSEGIRDANLDAYSAGAGMKHTMSPKQSLPEVCDVEGNCSQRTVSTAFACSSTVRGEVPAVSSWYQRLLASTSRTQINGAICIDVPRAGD